MFLVIIYENKRIDSAIAIHKSHEMARKSMEEIKLYIRKNPVRAILGVAKAEEGYDVYSLKAIRPMDVQLLKATTLAVLGPSAKIMHHQDLIVITNVLEGSTNGNNALCSIYNKSLKHHPLNRKYSGLKFAADAGNYRLVEAISFVRSKQAGKKKRA